MIIASLLASSSFIMTNKILIKAVGTDAAILLGELCSEYNYWEQRNELTNKHWFFSTRENNACLGDPFPHWAAPLAQ